MRAFATKLSKYVLYLSLHHSELYSITPESFLSTVTKPERGIGTSNIKSFDSAIALSVSAQYPLLGVSKVIEQFSGERIIAFSKR